MDLVAHKFLMSESAFDSGFVMIKSKELANLLSETLEPFLTEGSKFQNDSATFHEIGDSEDETSVNDYWKVVSAIESFPEVFAQALRLKAKLFLNPKRYQFIFPQPNDEYDPKTM